jgi:hypothetical protein
MLFYALDAHKGGVDGEELKKILIENDFRDVNDISARVRFL